MLFKKKLTSKYESWFQHQFLQNEKKTTHDGWHYANLPKFKYTKNKMKTHLVVKAIVPNKSQFQNLKIFVYAVQLIHILILSSCLTSLLFECHQSTEKYLTVTYCTFDHMNIIFWIFMYTQHRPTIFCF